MTVILKISNCMDCPFHEVQADPDRSDSFCNDDQKIVCTKKNRNITVACRPYHLRKEAEVPKWCPLPKK